jgi:hypothetical protein
MREPHLAPVSVVLRESCGPSSQRIIAAAPMNNDLTALLDAIDAAYRLAATLGQKEVCTVSLIASLDVPSGSKPTKSHRFDLSIEESISQRVPVPFSGKQHYNFEF